MDFKEVIAMPAAYTHYQFGNRIMGKLPENIRAEIARHRRLFDAGLQGADFFFYYRPWKANEITKLAYTYHRVPGTKFFRDAVSRLSGEEAQRVYLYGVLGHYALDSNCHPYVDGCVDEGKCSHSELETEYDRICLTRDGVALPHRFPIQRCVKITMQDACRIAALFPPATPAQIYESFTTFRILYRAMSSSVRGAVREQLTKFGQQYLMMYETPNLHVSGLIPGFDALYGKAMLSYPKLLDNLLQTIKNGVPLADEFEKPFDLTY